MMQGSLDERVRRLEAVEAIRRLKSRYCQLCDDGYSPDALAALFTKDAVWAGGPQRGVHQGQQAIRAFFVRVSADIPFAAHLVTNSVIDVDDDGLAASGEWRMLMPCTLRNETGLLAALQVAEYSELYRNEAGVWLIARIEVRVRRLSIENGAWIDLSGALGDYPAAVDVANLG